MHSLNQPEQWGDWAADDKRIFSLADKTRAPS
jgi:hypothetical protein